MTRVRTMNDDAVLEVLSTATTPLSAYQVLAALKDQGIQSPPVVYRALERLEKAGQIHRVEQLNAYVACPGDHEGRSVILAVCSCCKRVEEWPADAVDDQFAALAGASGFKLVQRSIEVSGLCAACQGHPAASATPTACCGAHGADHHAPGEPAAGSGAAVKPNASKTPAKSGAGKPQAPTASINLVYRPTSNQA